MSVLFACTNSVEKGEKLESQKAAETREEKSDTLEFRNENITNSQVDSALLVRTSKEIIAEFKKGVNPFVKINDFISSSGIIFIPYGYHSKDNVFLPKDSISYFWNSEQKVIWGSYDGSGDEIELTFKEYYKEFIWDMDFTQADTVMYEYSMGFGNTIDNLKEYIPSAKYVEFYIEGKNPDYGGMDWGLLRLIYDKDLDGRYKLIGISHGQWTV
jgi:hypothetical protein